MRDRARADPHRAATASSDAPLAALGGKGLFVKELEEALLDGRADLAVHSAKDLPAALAPGSCSPRSPSAPTRATRSSARGARASLAGSRAAPASAPGACGAARSSSPRGPDLEIVPLRGNVDTRLRKLEPTRGSTRSSSPAPASSASASPRASTSASHPRALLPAVGQGTLALETRAGERARRGPRRPRPRADPRGDPRRARLPRAPRGRLQRAARGVRAARGRTRRSRGPPREPGRRALVLRAEARAPVADAEGAGLRAAPRRCSRAAAARSSRRLAPAAGRRDGAARPRDARRRRPGAPDLDHGARRSRRCARPTSWSTTRSRRPSCSTRRRRTPSASTSASAATTSPRARRRRSTRCSSRAPAPGSLRGAPQGRRPFVFGRGGEEASACAARRRALRGRARRELGRSRVPALRGHSASPTGATPRPSRS